jgi:hypothetical protein
VTQDSIPTPTRGLTGARLIGCRGREPKKPKEYAYQREYRAKMMSENPEAVLEAEREAGRRSRAKRRIEKERTTAPL